MKAAAVIPARYASSRFPGKPMARLAGKPAIQHVWDAVAGSGLFAEVAVATDDDRIAQAVRAFGGVVVMTSPHCASGSDRVAEAAYTLYSDIIVNVQGDEPFLTAGPLEALLRAFIDPAVQVASLMHDCADHAACADPNRVKVVCAAGGDALYFLPRGHSLLPRHGQSRRLPIHIGVYAYRRQTLFDFVQMPHGRLEEMEKLEQLRLLEHGVPIRMVSTEYRGIGIDTPADLLRAEELLAGTGLE
jgi:3-deoxy-manno-octulosonate cytidylyltransferase (CMP-KDO synthetase)